MEIRNLHVFVDNKKILKGVGLTIKPGEVHAIMGPNGSGKSSFAYALMGHPSYKCQMSPARNATHSVAGGFGGKFFL